MSRSLKKRQLLIEKLKDYALELQMEGMSFFPTERELCAKFGASRETVRRGLEALEEERILLKESSKRLIAAPKTTLGELVFVASGWGVIRNPVWARIWAALEPLAKLNNIKPRLALYNWDSPEKTWPGELDKAPDAIIFTSAPNPEIAEHVFEMKTQCPIITTDEKYIGKADHVISFDNYEAGRMAADLILKKGRKRPALINWMTHYTPFLERQRGFVDALRDERIELTDEHIRTISCGSDQPGFINELIEQCKSIAKDYDSLWVHSDEAIGTVYSTINKITPIPDKFSLVTLNATTESRSNSPTINTMSHATGKIAMELVKFLKLMYKSKSDISKTIMKVKPDVYDGGTL